MATYTVCSEILQLSKENNYYLFNLLFYFIQDNDLKICLDEGDIVINIYRNIALDDVDVHSWIKWISLNKSKFEIVKIQGRTKTIKELFVLLCGSTFDKLLVTRNKQGYFLHQDLIEQNNIRIYDAEEIRNELATKIKVTISASGNNSTVETGDIIINKGKNK